MSHAEVRWVDWPAELLPAEDESQSFDGWQDTLTEADCTCVSGGQDEFGNHERVSVGECPIHG